MYMCIYTYICVNIDKIDPFSEDKEMYDNGFP